MMLQDFLAIMISVCFESFILIYYTNGTMECRESKMQSNIGICIGFAVYCFLCFVGNTTINLLGFGIITFFVIYIGFLETLGNAALKSILLTILMMTGELVVAMYFKIDLDNTYNQNISILKDIAFVSASKVLYCISVLVLKIVTATKNKKYSSRNILYFLSLPISTLVLFNCLGKICSELSVKYATVLIVGIIMLIVSNFIIYIAYDKMIENVLRIDELQKYNYKEKLDYVSYTLLKEKYEELKTMVHDFDKYCKSIEGELTVDQKRALSLLEGLRNKNKEFLLVEYTSNKALNILLSQKMSECNAKKIDLQIYVQDINLSFFDEMDIVPIFANLMDNAIESCQNSNAKRIFFSIYMMNNAYVVISVDNSCDNEPIVRNGVLKTKKQNKEQHGIGLMSVRKALDKYDGRLKWSYDKENKMFKMIVMISKNDQCCRKMTNVASFVDIWKK